MANHSPERPQNRLLAALPQMAFNRLASQLVHINLELKKDLITPNVVINDVYFPNNGIVSIVSDMPDGIIEVATVGNEGIIGLPIFLGTTTTTLRALVQIPGSAEQMKASVLLREVSMGGPLHELLHKYTQALIVQIAHTAACNRMHRVHVRCARWLLMSHDRVESDTVPLTQEFLGQMLGIRRPQVNGAMQRLKQLGAIDYSRGSVKILNRSALEAIVCECYHAVKENFDKLYTKSTAA